MIKLTKKIILSSIMFLATLQSSLQSCPAEYSRKGIKVKWSQTPTAVNVESDPLCYSDDNVVKRNCTENQWTPAIDDVEACSKVIQSVNSSSCPPGFHKISENNDEFCYRIGDNSAWDYPCFSSGGASVITDFDRKEMNSLFDSLSAQNISRYFWLPAHRPMVLSSVVWAIPGPNWGVQVLPNSNWRYQNLIWHNCLALDLKLRVLVTDVCSQVYPSLCFYINDINYPATCPKGYRAFRYKPDNGICYGIEKSDFEIGETFEYFLENKCKNPMSDIIDLNRFIFTKIAALTGLENHEWCWFKASGSDVDSTNIGYKQNVSHIISKFEGIINNAGSVGYIDSSSVMPCIACETEVIYRKTEFMIEYNDQQNRLYITIYFPSGLWKYNNDDKGIQCFSDAKGFVKVVNISDLPFLSVDDQNFDRDGNSYYIEKVVYNIDLITQRSAQYWCEGHTFNFSLLSTNKLVVNPKGKEIHVFALTLEYFNFSLNNDTTEIDSIIAFLTEIFGAQKLLWMQVNEVRNDSIIILFHVHITVVNSHQDDALNINDTYNNLKISAEQHLPTLNCSFISLKSSVYCLPTTSNDSMTLDWELTLIGHISAPKQFCLQSNGLPVKRQCTGTYHQGGQWGIVEGTCDSNYVPSETTEYLYNVVKVPNNFTSRFLTEGLEFVLSDINTIIPADIYYLSMSLQQVLQVAQQNNTCVDLGDIENIAWVMDRVMAFDGEYLRLAQTLNSTNVILNSVNDIIEMIASQYVNDTFDNVSSKSDEIELRPEPYELAVKPQFVIQISYPLHTNVTGLAISKKTDTDKFSNMLVTPLYTNTTIEEVLAIENLEIATWLPLKLINTLRHINESEEEPVQRNDIHVIISVFQNDAVFQELVANAHIVNSRIVGVSIPGFISNLEHPLQIVFRELSQYRDKKLCGFWDFEMQKTTLLSGFWQTQGCFPVNSTKNITICECYHLTHFSQLITIPIKDMQENHNLQHTTALNMITLVGCFLSLLGIVGIWITALVFANWRKKAGTKVLLQLSTAISLPLVFIVVFNLDNSIFVHENGIYVIAIGMKPLCIVLGSLLHYSILSSFMWMLITAILQFIRYVRVLGVSRPSRFMFKFSLIGWGIPIIPVLIILLLDVENYVPDSSYCKRLCYPKGYYFILGVMLPICIILLVNIILFLMVLHSISRGSNEKMKSTDFDLVGAQLRLSIFLFFLLGLTWIFGIFSFTSNLLWAYLFCLTSTLQGLVLFIYFIICDPATRNLWITLMKPPFTTSSSRNSITSLT